LPYGFYKIYKSVEYCCTPQLDPQVNFQFKELLDGYEHWTRSEDQTYYNNLRGRVTAKRNEQAAALDRFENAQRAKRSRIEVLENKIDALIEDDEDQADEIGADEAQIDAELELTNLRNARDPEFVPISDMSLAMEDAQARNEAVDRREHEADAREGRKRRRLRRTHVGLYTVVDIIKSLLPRTTKVLAAQRLSARDIARRTMEQRNWRSTDIAQWIDIAVELALTPTRAEINAEMLKHCSSVKARKREFLRLGGGSQQSQQTDHH
jgi:hypothetical protein